MRNDKKTIGRFHLAGIPPAPRGVPQIEVTFDIDANGILNVSALDKATGKSQNIRIEASSGLSEDEIKRMKAEAEAHADADKKAKEEIEKINGADGFLFSASLSKCHRHFFIFQSEKNLKEYGDKIPADKKSAIENAHNELKAAHSARNVQQIDVDIHLRHFFGRLAIRQITNYGEECAALDVHELEMHALRILCRLVYV